MRKISLPYALAAGAVLVLPGAAVVAPQVTGSGGATSGADGPEGEVMLADPADDPKGSWLEDFGVDVSDFDVELDHLEEVGDPDDEAVATLAGQSTDSTSPVVDALSASGIPEIALRAYVRAEDGIATTDPGCGLSWSLLAGIARVESNHGYYGGAQLREDGSTTEPIRGIPLDGRPGVLLILDTDDGVLDGDTVYDRAVGPMQFIPSTWRSVEADGTGDGSKDPDNIFDAALGAAVYLCSGGGDLTDDAQLRAAVYRYNRSTEYVNLVLSLAAAYEEGRGDALPDPVGPSGGSGSTASEPVLPDPVPTVEEPASVGLPPGLIEGSGGRNTPRSTSASSASWIVQRRGPLDVGPPTGSGRRPTASSERGGGAAPSPRPTTTTTTSTTTTTTTTTTTLPPVDPVDPVEPVDPTDPVDPGDPVEPTEPAEPEPPEEGAGEAVEDEVEVECADLLEALDEVQGSSEPSANLGEALAAIEDAGLEDVLLEAVGELRGEPADLEDIEQVLLACCPDGGGDGSGEVAVDDVLKGRLEDTLGIELVCDDAPDDTDT